MISLRVKMLIIKLISPLGRIVRERDSLRRELKSVLEEKNEDFLTINYVPNGHFYSPIPNLKEVQSNEIRIFASKAISLPGIDLNLEVQWEHANDFVEFYSEFPYQQFSGHKYRYSLENNAFCESDAVFLYSMLRKYKPNRFVEVGSGYSSALILDVNEQFLNKSCEMTFIEPYPQLLKSLLSTNDSNVRIIDSLVQDVPIKEFLTLQRNDVLFIDSTHVSKVGSDVNYLLLEVLPRLNPGVIVHIHDIFKNFEYPKEWVYEGRAWNESYLLRALLIGNSDFKVLFFGNFMVEENQDWFAENLPITLKNHGGSLWLQKD